MMDLNQERFAHRLGIRILQIRRGAGLDQGQLAHQVDMSPGYLSLIENGQRLPSVPMLGRIAAALDVPLFELFVLAE